MRAIRDSLAPRLKVETGPRERKGRDSLDGRSEEHSARLPKDHSGHGGGVKEKGLFRKSCRQGIRFFGIPCRMPPLPFVHLGTEMLLVSFENMATLARQKSKVPLKGKQRES